ncbi:MAG: helix-turn-helix transcriptional regulator, partial [Oscillospiraceae bacterium]|nr:helix-turn-helix transcriptional regulator [Oscillospiraceae bacterium]
RAEREKERERYLSRVQKAVTAFSAQYSDYLAAAGPPVLQSLRKKELEVLRLICQGRTTGEMRDILGISENTLKTHVRKLYQKLGVNSRTSAQAAARRLGLYKEEETYEKTHFERRYCCDADDKPSACNGWSGGRDG